MLDTFKSFSRNRLLQNTSARPRPLSDLWSHTVKVFGMKLKDYSIDAFLLLEEVDLRPYVAISRASGVLSHILTSLEDHPIQQEALLTKFNEDHLLSILPAGSQWYELVRIMLEGTTQSGAQPSHDRDQVMPLRSYWRSTRLLCKLLSENDRLDSCSLTEDFGLGIILYYCLTCQGESTAGFARSVGIPRCADDVFRILEHWDVDKDGPYENQRQFGQPNAYYTFFSGTSTNLASPAHQDRVKARLELFFGDSMRSAWKCFLGKSYKAILTHPNHEPSIPYHTALEFFTEVGSEHHRDLPGLTPGSLMLLQVVNNLVELKLVQESDAGSLSLFAGLAVELGAAKGLSILGFSLPPERPKSLVHNAVAFHASYEAIQRGMKGDGHFQPRFSPSDHEHRLCKMARILEKIKGDTRLNGKMEDWIRRWLPSQDMEKYSVTVDDVTRSLDKLKCALYSFTSTDILTDWWTSFPDQYCR